MRILRYLFLVMICCAIGRQAYCNSDTTRPIKITSSYSPSLKNYDKISFIPLIINDTAFNTQPQFLQVIISLKNNDLKSAYLILSELCARADRRLINPEILFARAEVSYYIGKIDTAIRYYQDYLQSKVAKRISRDYLARYGLGYSYLQKQQYAISKTYFEPIAKNVSLNSDPITQDAYLRTADAYYMARSYAQARTMYDNVIRFSWPAEDYATFQKAMIAGINSSNEKIGLMNTLIRKFPSSPLVADANMEIASTYMAEERFRDAIPYLNNIIKANKNASLKLQAYLKLGLAYINLNNSNEAIAQFKQLINTYPDAPEADVALENLRTIYIEQSRPTEYADVARLAGKPLSVSAEDSLTYVVVEKELEEGNSTKALNALNNYLTRFPEGFYTINAHYFNAMMLSEKKDWEKALSNYEIIIERSPNKFAESALAEAAKIAYTELKDLPMAERYYIQLKNLSASQLSRIEACRGILKIQYDKEQWKRAYEAAEDLLKLKSITALDSAFANINIGNFFSSMKDCHRAIDCYRTAMGLSQEYKPEAKCGVADCHIKLNNLEEAERIAAEVRSATQAYEPMYCRSSLIIGTILLKQNYYSDAILILETIFKNAKDEKYRKEAKDMLDSIMQVEKKLNSQ